MSKQHGQKILLAISSSIAGYKVLELQNRLEQNDYLTKLVVSPVAYELFEPILKQKKVYTDLFDLPKNSDFQTASNLLQNELAKNPDPQISSRPLDYKKYLKNQSPIPHIYLADWADLIVIAPATANTIGKLANGIYDNLLTSTVSATSAKIIVAPAMNVKMWQNQIVQENVAKLQRYGFEFVGPESGDLACGYQGVGRLASLDLIEQKIEQVLQTANNSPLYSYHNSNKASLDVNDKNSPKVETSVSVQNRSGVVVPVSTKFVTEIKRKAGLPSKLKASSDVSALDVLKSEKNIESEGGKMTSTNVSSKNQRQITVLITCGGSSEYIDEVRFISNRSSGKMGIEIAKNFVQQGYSVILLKSKTATAKVDFVTDLNNSENNGAKNETVNQAPTRLVQYEFFSSQDLESLMQKHVPSVDVVVHCAAVSDFVPQKNPGKLDSSKEISLVLQPGRKILGNIKKWNSGCFLVSFKLEAGTSPVELIKIAQQSLQKNQSDLVAANLATTKTGMDTETNEVWVVGKSKKVTHLPLSTKSEIARQLVKLICADLFTQPGVER